MRKVLLLLLMPTLLMAQEKLTDGALENWTYSDSLTDGGLETWDSGDTTLTNWSELWAGASRLRKTTDSKVGTNAAILDIDGSGNYVQVYQDPNLAGGTDYVLSLFHKESGDSGDVPRILVQCVACTPDSYLQADGSWGASAYRYVLPYTTTYDYYELPFTSHGSSGAYRFVIEDEATAASCSLYIDDISVTTPINNLTSWGESVSGTSVLLRDGTNQHGGSYCARFEIDGSNNAVYLFQSNLSLTNTNACSLSFWHKETGSAIMAMGIQCFNCNPTINLSNDTTTWTTVSTYINTGNSATWIQSLFVFPLDSTATNYRILAKSKSAANETLYIDDLSFIEYAPASGGASQLIMIDED